VIGIFEAINNFTDDRPESIAILIQQFQIQIALLLAHPELEVPG
jgi:hypothetical protein